MSHHTALLPDRQDTTEELEDRGLVERVELALRATGYAPLRAVGVTARGRQITLEGRVPSYYLKQVAQAAVLAVLADQRVCNNLDVKRS
jgi:osmotically-inducible protein OsmY